MRKLPAIHSAGDPLKVSTAPEVSNLTCDILNSWKEIALYLNRGVRTVQRWEAELGLPVRRPRAKSRSAVIALRSEIDQWLKSCSIPEQKTSGHVPAIASTRKLLIECRELRANLRNSRAQLRAELAELKEKLTKLSISTSVSEEIEIKSSASVA